MARNSLITEMFQISVVIRNNWNSPFYMLLSSDLTEFREKCLTHLMFKWINYIRDSKQQS